MALPWHVDTFVVLLCGRSFCFSELSPGSGENLIIEILYCVTMCASVCVWCVVSIEQVISVDLWAKLSLHFGKVCSEFACVLFEVRMTFARSVARHMFSGRR